MGASTLKYDSDDLSPDDVVATGVTGRLHDSNAYLGDPQALRKRFDEEGYLLFRGVLDPQSVAKAQSKMMSALEVRGLVREDATGNDPQWSGKSSGDLDAEESPEFEGLAVELATNPKNMAFFDRVLGEPGMIVPIAKLRFYPPGVAMGPPHQDGYYTQISGFMIVWVPLTEITEDMGGLAVAVGQTERGYLHNPDKQPPSPIPKDAIPPEAWAKTTYRPGDVLIFHNRTPHCGLPNYSNRLRLTFDIRLIPQSSAKNMFVGTVTDVTPYSVTLCNDHGTSKTFQVDDDTYIRCKPGNAVRIPLSEFTDAATRGSHLICLHDDGHAAMLRRASG